MKTKIAAWLMSMALTINGGPIEVEETEPVIIPETVITETVVTESIIPESIVIEDIVTEEHEGKPLSIDKIKSSRLYEALNASYVAVADKGNVVFGDAKEVMAKIGDKIIFWN